MSTQCREATTEIEITDEMIEAGRGVIRLMLPDVEETMSYQRSGLLVASVFDAMLDAQGCAEVAQFSVQIEHQSDQIAQA
jgi:hypothetical protein